MQEVEDEDASVAIPPTRKRCNTLWETEGDGKLHTCITRGTHEVHICIDDDCDAGLMVGMEPQKRRGEDYRVR